MTNMLENNSFTRFSSIRPISKRICGFLTNTLILPLLLAGRTFDQPIIVMNNC